MQPHLPLLVSLLSLVGAAFAWFWNERRKRASEEYARKEKKYEALIDGLQGFYASTSGSEGDKMKQQFLQELNKCWLYCPDEVIKKAYAFIDTQKVAKHTDADKEKLVGELMTAIRTDLLSRRPVKKTHLTATDFQILSAKRAAIPEGVSSPETPR